MQQSNNNSKININISNFSDAIIITLYGKGNFLLTDAFWIYLIGFILIPIFRKAFVNKIFLRGTISIGKFFIKKREDGILFLGPSIYEVAKYYENSNWIGISTSSSTTLLLWNKKTNYIITFVAFKHLKKDFYST